MHTDVRYRNSIDLNADLGEGGQFDSAILRLVSSANIACGGHTGNTESMRAAVRLAKENHVAIGAHPSFKDRPNFGRRAMAPPYDHLFDDLCEQVRILQSIVKDEGAHLHHLKPHGALYNQAAEDASLGQVLIEVILACDPQLSLVTLAGSTLIVQAQRAGIRTIAEAFGDRRYQANGRLVPRADPLGCIDNVNDVIAQVASLIENQTVTAIDGSIVHLQINSLCVHGDGEQALNFVRAIHKYLRSLEIEISPSSIHFVRSIK